MVNFRTSFTYIFNLMSLMIVIGMVSQCGPVEVEGLPAPTPSATPLPEPEPFPGAARLARCKAVSEPRFFFYIPALTPEPEKALTIFGTVYASDLTPLSGALVEIWPDDVSRVNHPYPPIIFGGRLHTDEAGHYELATTKFNWSKISYLHYRVTYQDHCPLVMHLHLLREPPSKPAEHIVTKVQVVGPILQGPVNIVMPAPPQP